MLLRPARSTRTDTLFPYTTLVRSASAASSLVVLPPGKSSRLKPLLHKIKTDDATPHSSNSNIPMLDMRQVTKVYRTELVGTHALRSLDLHVKEGEFVAVTVPSGSVKTTFLNIAGLLETFTGGEFTLYGENVKGLSDNQRSKLRNQKIGFIFHSFNLITDLNLFDNCDVPLHYHGMQAHESQLRTEDALGMVGMGSRMKASQAQITVGHQQRAANGMRPVGRPRPILPDEPNAN